MKNWLRHSLRLFRQELKRGELTIIALALILSVSSVFSLTGFTEYIKQSLIQQSARFIAADRVLKSPRAITPELLVRAQQEKLDYVEQVEMSSIVFAGNNMALASIKASSQGYPLRGALLVRTAEQQQPQAVSIPALGEVWLESKAFNTLKVKLGDNISVGESDFKIAGEIIQIPDASFSVFTSGPVLILNVDDLAATQLVQPASRLTYKYLFSGEPASLKNYDRFIKEQLNESQRWQNIQSGTSPLAKALVRAEQYLSLASMLGVLLAATAISVASRRYSQRHQATVAVFKAMGASKQYVTKLYFTHWLLLSVVSMVLGLILGFVLMQLGLWLSADIFNTSGQGLSAYFKALWLAVLTGSVCVIVFSLQPFMTLVSVSPMAILRGYQEKFRVFWYHSLLVLVSVFALLYLFSQNVLLSGALIVGTMVLAVILLVIAKLFINLGRKLGSQAGKAWHLAFANLKRRANENAVQLLSFTVAIKLLLLIVVIKTAIIQEWQQQLPEDSPNRFLININEQQRIDFEKFIAQNNIPSSGIYPVVRGRLTAINDDQLSRNASKEEDNSRTGVGRELNLTWQATPPEQNKIVAGQWWPSDVAVKDNKQVSVEEQLAERLGIRLGDQLTFLIGINEIKVTVSNFRQVNWQSMQPNFYMILHPSLLTDFPATYISAVRINDEHKSALQVFLSEQATISMIDVEQMLMQLREVISKVSVALQFILLLVIAAGALVLVAQVQASMEERERELAILRTLGAKGSILKRSVFYEFLALGAIAGLIASIAMEFAVYIIQYQVFNMQPSFHFRYWLLAIACGSGFVGGVGMLSCWRLLNVSSMNLIRRTQ